MDDLLPTGPTRTWCLALGASLAAMLLPADARAYDTTVGDWQVNIDTTLSSSVAVRTSAQDSRFIGTVNGGRLGLANADDGDLNFRSGDVVGAVQRITTEVQVKHDDYGVFLRGTAFVDPVIDGEDTDFKKLSRAAERDIGADARLLDAYVFASPKVFDHVIDIRVGAQALNWGESTFIIFGINSINPLDATALRTPGSELRQGFLPIPVVDLKTSLAGGFSLEGFWQFAWKRSRLEPSGSFYATNDDLFDGGRHGAQDNLFPDNARAVYGVDVAGNDLFGAAIPRSLDRHPTTLDEFGFALRKTFAGLGDAELGLYFENYHSRTPFGSYRTGNGNDALPVPISLLFSGPGYASRTYNSTASYFADYPKDIHLLGFSWNFQGPAGVAIQGEVSSRIDQPIQLSSADLGLAIEVPAIRGAIRALGPFAPEALRLALAQALGDPTIRALDDGLGSDGIIDGWQRYPVVQAQQTATKVFASIPSLSISSVAVVGEIGFDYVADFPRDRGIFGQPYSTNVDSAFTRAAVIGGEALSTKGLATQTSGSYTVATVIDVPNVLPYGIDMKPVISLRHDFLGTSPIGVNTFVENTAAASVGVTFNYLQAWSAGFQYTNHFPVFAGGKFYGLIDRDFLSATLSYEF